MPEDPFEFLQDYTPDPEEPVTPAITWFGVCLLDKYTNREPSLRLRPQPEPPEAA